VGVAGTHNLADWGTDAYLAVGKLKDTNRYKEAKSTLEKAKEKYQPKKTVLAGHSLGGGITNGIASGEDKVMNLDPAYTIGQKARTNVQNYRTNGDIVSLFAPKSNTKTLQNNYTKTGILPLDILNAHNVNQIKNDKIFF
jgi:predicted alpha/beta-fold hydrolase